MRESWSLYTVRRHFYTLLDFNDCLKEKAEANNLMTNTSSKEYRYNQPSNQRHLLQLHNESVFKNRNTAFCQHLSHDASYARAIFGWGSVVCLRKRLPRSKPKLLLKQSSVSLVCVINTSIGNAKVPVNVEKIAAKTLITPYFTKLSWFSQLHPQTATSVIQSWMQALVGLLLVNSKATTLSSVSDVKRLLRGTELKLTNSSGTSTTALVLCHTAWSNYWMSDSLP